MLLIFLYVFFKKKKIFLKKKKKEKVRRAPLSGGSGDDSYLDDHGFDNTTISNMFERSLKELLGQISFWLIFRVTLLL